MRLEQEVKQRKQGWSYPPLSGAAAVMRRHQGGQGLDLGPRHEVDYRTLCLTTLTKLEKFALQRLNSEAVRFCRLRRSSNVGVTSACLLQTYGGGARVDGERTG